MAQAAFETAKSELCDARLCELRARYASALDRSSSPIRTRAAQHLTDAAAIFEKESRACPSRSKKAIECMRLAVLMIESKVKL